jgi:DNA-binding transcriptional ArsR family regulator
MEIYNPTPETLNRLGQLFKALANPIRLAIIWRLYHSPYCVQDLMASLAATQPLVSQHLRILRAAHLVRATRRGKTVVYSLQDRQVGRLVQEIIRYTQRERID